MIAPGGVHLIELKDWHGSVESRNGTWLQTQPSGRQSRRLSAAARRSGTPTPRVQAGSREREGVTAPPSGAL